MNAEVIPARGAGALDRAVDVLRAGGIVAIPTETVYGLAVIPEQDPLGRLVEAKKRSADKGIALLIDSAGEMERAATVPDGARRLADRFWPGPLTLVLPIAAGAAVPETLTGGRPTIAFRLPDHDVPRELARRLGPIAASSANVSGQPDATTAEGVLATLGDVVDLVLDDGPVRGGVPSTVVAFVTADADVSIVREGALSVDEIRSTAG